MISLVVARMSAPNANLNSFKSPVEDTRRLIGHYDEDRVSTARDSCVLLHECEGTDAVSGRHILFGESISPSRRIRCGLLGYSFIARERPIHYGAEDSVAFS